MNIIDHRQITNTALESIEWEMLSGKLHEIFAHRGFSLVALNNVMSQFNLDYFCCFGHDFPSGMHVCVSFIHGGVPTSQFTWPMPELTESQAMWEAVRWATDYLRDNPINMGGEVEGHDE